MEQDNKKKLSKYFDLVTLGNQILKKHGWNKKNNNNMYSIGSPSKEDYSGYLTSCISLVEDTLGKESPSYLMIKKLIDNEKTSKNPYYFAECFGIIKAAYEVYSEKYLSENKLDILLEEIEELIKKASCFNDTKNYDTDFILWRRAFKNIFETYEFVNNSYEETFNHLKFETNFSLDVSMCLFDLDRMKQDINTYGEKAVKIKEQKKIKETSKIFNSKQVFIVHGHNVEKKVETASIIEKLGLEPIILHKQANKGRTILKKLSECSDNISFAIILLTADDLGKDKDTTELKKRARQNVVFELGYFIARLGEKNVCSLYENGVEIPTDYSGVTFIEFDNSGYWNLELVRELKAAGFNVDANSLL